MSYAILRTAKLTSLANVSGSARHNFRERATPNADSDKTSLNRTTGAQTAKEVLAGVQERLATQAKVRKNAVLAVEYFIGASPEFFDQADAKQREAYFDRAEKWLRDKHGAKNVIAVTRQYDETSPHICAYVVPIDPKGKLNCSHFLDGREKLTQMQTEFAERVGQDVGLERGIEGSQAKHKTIKQYYAEIQAPVKHVAITPEVLAPKVLDKGLFTSKQESPEMVAERVTKAVQAVYEPAVQAAKQHHIEKAAAAARARDLAELRATATVARDLPLETVLARLGCERDPKDRKNWRTPAGRVTVDGPKFFAHDVGKGGGGAIDLAMLIEQTDYKGAVQLLAREFGTGAVLEQTAAVAKRVLEEAVKAPPEPYRAPEPVPEHWPRVRRYLTEARRLGGELVDQLHKLGKVYADRYANCVFVLGKGGEGVELRGTGDQPFHGVRGSKQPFVLQPEGEPKKLALVESAVDALSLRELGFKGGIMSLAGGPTEKALKHFGQLREGGWTIVAAFDKDQAGDRFAAQLGQPAERLVPTHGKDWNDELRALRATPAERQAQELQQAQKRSRRGPSLER